MHIISKCLMIFLIVFVETFSDFSFDSLPSAFELNCRIADNGTDSCYTSMFSHSLVACVEECLLRPARCRAVIYRRLLKFCRLCEATVTGIETQIWAGSLMCEMMPEYSNLIPTCTSNTCSDSWKQKCNTGGRSGCQNSECSLPPQLDWATSSSNETTIGITITYQCISGYQQSSGTSSEITCQSDGQWSYTDFRCIPKSTGVGLNEQCSANTDCISGAVCTGSPVKLCQCGAGYRVNGDICITIVALGEACTMNAECVDGAECLSDGVGSITCQCPETHYNNFGECLELKALHDMCSTTEECIDGAECFFNSCQCTGAFVETNGQCLVSQWVARVLSFSSEWGLYGYNAESVIGEPDLYPSYGDLSGAWAPKDEATPFEYVNVQYDQAVYLETINIYETYNAGGVVKIKAKRTDDSWDTLWSTPTPEHLTSSRIFSPTITPPTYLTDTIRIEINQTASGDYVEIDAIGIMGRLP